MVKWERYETVDKRLLAVGGIAALIGAVTLAKIDTQPVILTPATEYAAAKIGDELKTLRRENVTAHKAADGRIVRRIGAVNTRWRDRETGEYRDIDTAVKSISALAEINPLKTHDRYIDAGPYSAAWFAGREQSYRFYGGGLSIEYEAAYDTTGVSVAIEGTADGVKQTYTLKDAAASGELTWRVISDADSVTESGGELTFWHNGSGAAWTARPVAWDADAMPVPVEVSYMDGVLRYSVMTDGAAFPVTVDPTTTISPNSANTGGIGWYINAANKRNEYSGNTAGSSSVAPAYFQNNTTGLYTIARWLWRFDMSTVEIPTYITSATFNIYVINSYNFTQNVFLAAANDDSVAVSEALNVTHFNEFTGWATSGAYSPVALSDTIAYPVNSADTLSFVLTDDFISQIRDACANGDTLQFYMLSTNDTSNSLASGIGYAIGSVIDGNSYFEIESENLQTEYTKTFSVSDAFQHYSVNNVYDTARSDTTDTVVSNDLISGQAYFGSPYYDYYVYRSSLEINMPSYNVSSAESLIINTTNDGSDTDFNLRAYTGTWVDSDSTYRRYWKFDGWHNGTSPYAGTNLLNDWSTASYSAGRVAIAFNAAGKQALYNASGDKLRLLLMSSRDVAGTTPTGGESISFNMTGGGLKMTYALNDSAATDIVAMPESDTSITVTWRDRTYDEDGFYIVSVPDSAVVDSVSAGIETCTVGGLSPNTLYRFLVKVKGGIFDDVSSAIDSTYTNAAVPPAPDLYYAGGPVFRADMPLLLNAILRESGALTDSTHKDYSQYNRTLTAKYPSQQPADFDTLDSGLSVMDFNGTTDLIDTGANMIGTGSVTGEAWICARTRGEGNSGIIMSNGAKFDFGLSSNVTNDKWRLQLTSNASTYIYSQAGQIAANTWTHVVFTRTSAGITNFFINGVLSGTPDQSSGTPGATSTTVKIGNWGTAPNYTFDGQISGVRIYSGVPADSTAAAAFAAERYAATAALYGGTALDDSLINAALFGLPRTMMHVVIDTTGTGNPSYTEYAVQDSISGLYVQRAAGSSSIFDAAEDWNTFDGWGAAYGDTVAVDVGKKYTFRVKARSGQ